ESSGGNRGCDEGRAAPLNGCCLHSAELHHRSAGEALPENADLDALLAGGGDQIHERPQPHVQTVNHAATTTTAIGAGAADISFAIERAIRVLSQRGLRISAVCHVVAVKIVENGESSGCRDTVNRPPA